MKRAGGHPDVDVEVVEIDAVDRLVEGAQSADLVDGATGAPPARARPTREREGPAAAGVSASMSA